MLSRLLPRRLTLGLAASLLAIHRDVADGAIRVGGHYEILRNGILVEEGANLVPTEGLNTLLDVYSGTLAVPTQSYIALHANALTPLATHTAATYNGNYAEITSGSEGYTETTRVQWTHAAASAGVKDNYASPAVFTIATATSLAVNGVALIATASAKGATTGKLISAYKFAATKSFDNTDLLSVKYRLTLTP